MAEEPADDGVEPDFKRANSETDGGEPELGPSVVFDVLADERARLALYLLDERGGTIPIDELASTIAAWECRGTTDTSTAETEERIVRNLYHVVVPKLTDRGIATFDRASGAVTLRERAGELEPYLSFAKKHETGDVEEFLDRRWRNGRK